MFASGAANVCGRARIPAPAIAPLYATSATAPSATSTRRSILNAGKRVSTGLTAQTIVSAPSSATFAQNSVVVGAISSTARRPIETE